MATIATAVMVTCGVLFVGAGLGVLGCAIITLMGLYTGRIRGIRRKRDED